MRRDPQGPACFRRIASPGGGTSAEPRFAGRRMGAEENMELRFRVNNVLDSDPSIVGYEPGENNALGATNPGYYDVIGRRYVDHRTAA